MLNLPTMQWLATVHDLFCTKQDGYTRGRNLSLLDILLRRITTFLFHYFRHKCFFNNSWHERSRIPLPVLACVIFVVSNPDRFSPARVYVFRNVGDEWVQIRRYDHTVQFLRLIILIQNYSCSRFPSHNELNSFHHILLRKNASFLGIPLQYKSIITSSISTSMIETLIVMNASKTL